MQAFLANLTAAMLFIHAAFGCGWHHAHGENHPATVLAADHCCDHHHHHDGQHGDESTPPQNSPAPCCEHCGVSCVYTVPHKVELDSQFTVSWLDLVATLPAVTTSHTVTLDWLATAEDERATAPPLRLHLLHQLLTI
jgi:hypothetical protein